MRKFWFWSALFAAIAALMAAPTENVARTRVADGFDFPVGKPDAEGYYKARGFRPNGHLGEDWNGIGGGDTDLGDPIYSIAHGYVVFARDVRLGWGNVVIVRHTYLERGKLITIDSLYGHLDRIAVKEGQQVLRGQLVGTMGTNRGMYPAHLHLEIRKNLFIGMNRSAFKRDFSNYYSPTDFITPHRKMQGGGRSALIAINTFQDKRTFESPSKSEISTARNQDDSSTASGVIRSTGKRKSTFKVDRFGDLESL
jgi:hypothetical protein